MSEPDKTDFVRKTDAGIKRAIAEAIEEHRRMEHSIAVWRAGKVVIIPPSEIQRLQNESKDPAVKNQQT